MIITKRIVKAGKITGYEVEDNGVRTVLDANTVLANTDDITDARALDEVETSITEIMIKAKKEYEEKKD